MDKQNEKQNLVSVESTYGLPADMSGLGAYAKTGSFVGTDFLRVNGKTGRTTYGIENLPLPTNAQLAVLIGQAQAGFIDWTDGAKTGEEWLALINAWALTAHAHDPRFVLPRRDWRVRPEHSNPSPA